LTNSEEIEMTQSLIKPRAVTARPTLLTPAFMAVTLAALAYFTGDGILIPALPRYVEGPLGAGNVAVGLVVGAFSVSAFFLRPWAGSLGDRWGRRPLMLVGACLFAASVLGYGVASSPTVLAALRLLTGAGEAFFFVGAITAVSDLAPAERRGEAMSLASLALYVGIGVGPLLGELVIERFGFAAAWILAAAAALSAVALALRVADTRPDSTSGAGVEPAPRHRLVHPAGLLPGLVMLTSIVGMAGFLTFVPLYALDIGMGGSRVVLLVFAGIVVAIRSLGGPAPRPARHRSGHPDGLGPLGSRSHHRGDVAHARRAPDRHGDLRHRDRPVHTCHPGFGRGARDTPGAGISHRDDLGLPGPRIRARPRHTRLRRRGDRPAGDVPGWSGGGGRGSDPGWDDPPWPPGIVPALPRGVI
jgi:MFS family permease